MADEKQLKILRSGVEKWNAWHKEYPQVQIDFRGAELSLVRLPRADLRGAILDVCGKFHELEEYGRRWTALIEKYGGTHVGYFLPDNPPDDTSSKHFSFPGLGAEGPTNVGIALYSFRDLDAYNAYRRIAAEDEECKAVTAHFNETKCVVGYERNFVRRIE